MLRWPLPEDSAARRVLMMHESWHRVQGRIGLAPSAPANSHLDTLDGRYMDLLIAWYGQLRYGTPGSTRVALSSRAPAGRRPIIGLRLPRTKKRSWMRSVRCDLCSRHMTWPAAL